MSTIYGAIGFALKFFGCSFLRILRLYILLIVADKGHAVTRAVHAQLGVEVLLFSGVLSA